MAYDETYPTSNDTVSAAKLRENFLAILEGRVSHEKVTLGLDAVPVAGTADSAVLYAKDVDSGGTDYAEFHAIDEQNNEIQITSNGRLGSATTPSTVQNVRFGTSTIDYNINSGVTAWAYHDGGAGAAPTADFELGTVSRTATGTFQFTFDNAMSNANYGVVGTVENTSNVWRGLMVSNKTTTTFTVKVVDETGTRYNALPFTVTVVGGR